MVPLPFSIAIQEMCARIALATDQGISSVIRRHYSRAVLYGIVSLLLIANTINLGADLGAMADSARLLLPLPYYFYILVFGLIAILLEVFISYKRYAPMLKLLTVSLLAYVLTGLMRNSGLGNGAQSQFSPRAIRFPIYDDYRWSHWYNDFSLLLLLASLARELRRKASQ